MVHYVSFWKSMEITGGVLEWRKVFQAQLLPGWNYGVRGHICCDPTRGFLLMQHINNCWDRWCSQLQGALWVWNIVGGGMKNGGDLKVLQGFRRWSIVGGRTKNGGVWKVRQDFRRWSIVGGRTKNGGVWKVLKGFWIWGWVEKFRWNWVFFVGSGRNRGV